MDSPEWLIKELNMLLSVTAYPNLYNEYKHKAVKQASQAINQRFEAALKIRPELEERAFDNLRNHARARWYNQPDQEEKDA